MGPTLLLLASGLYLGAAITYGRQRNWGYVIAFVAYAVANCGFAYAAWRGR